LDDDSGSVRITADSDFAAVLKLLEQQINDAESDAAKAVLVAERERFLNSGLIQAEKLAEQSQEACDESAVVLGRLGETPQFEEFDTGRLDLSFEKLFRNGIFFSPFLTGEYDSTQFIGKRNGFFEPVLRDDGQQEVQFGIPRERFVDFGGKNVEDLYTIRIGFEVNIPLLRNRGREAVAAPEGAARNDREAAAMLLKHSAAESVLATTAAYWELRASQQREEVLEGSVSRQQQLETITCQLIARGEIIGAQRSRARASLASARAQLDAARRDVFTAQSALLKAMGLEAGQPEQALEVDSPFPAPPDRSALWRLIEDPHLLEASLHRRYDLAALEYFAESSTLLTVAAEINRRSQLDFSAGAWTTATGESSFSAAINRWVTPSWRVGVSFEKPFGNHAALGRLQQSRSRLRQDQISTIDRRRNVRINITQTLNTLAAARTRVEQAEQAAGYYNETIAAEFELFEEGQSNIVDSILTEQQQTDALLSRIDARRELAVLLARLRFETGTLVMEAEAGPTVTLAAITTLPGNGS